MELWQILVQQIDMRPQASSRYAAICHDFELNCSADQLLKALATVQHQYDSKYHAFTPLCDFGPGCSLVQHWAMGPSL